MKVGDMVRPHSGIRRFDGTQSEDLIGIILELEKRGSKLSGSRQAAVVCWSTHGFEAAHEWTYALEVISESR